MRRDPVTWVASRATSSKPLFVQNKCGEVIYPAILTQAGTGPSTTGFKLSPGASMSLSVSADWQGRVWGRTNCTFNSAGTGPDHSGGVNGNGAACVTGDCGGTVQCQLAGASPATLAEFTFTSGQGQTFYDISLVDGYNLPMGIEALFSLSGNSTLEDIPPNLTNPICIGTSSLLAEAGSSVDALFGSNSSFPIPLDTKNTAASVASWCPWDLQVNPPYKPGDGVYPYPDDNIQRPIFDPCLSACAKTQSPSDCCTGSYDNPSVCGPNYYSTQAKGVCPDAYSYAFDDQTSTFIVPEGGGFGVVFCPRGRSSNILATLGSELRAIAAMGKVTPQQLDLLQNATLIQEMSAESSIAAGSRVGEVEKKAWLALVVGIAMAVAWEVL
ncbi:MAG: hypothetical protein LQ340_007375 [Diploschistes diacapsis]|nr:MAG: hypothetical protein LQ340_007375 [Diploschistes diacapsis]